MPSFFKSAMRQPAFLISIIITILGIITYMKGIYFLEIVELKTIDLRFRARGEISPGTKVVMAVVDEKSLDNEGKWVWPRSKFAKLIDRLSNAGVSVVAIDIGFHEPDDRRVVEAVTSVQKTVQKLQLNNIALNQCLVELKSNSDNDNLLAESIQKSKSKIVLGWFFHADRSSLAHLDEKVIQQYQDNIKTSRYLFTRSDFNEDPDLTYIQKIAPEPNIKQISLSTDYSGFFNFSQGTDGVVSDGVVRWFPSVLQFDGEIYAPLSLKALGAHMDTPIHLEVGAEGQIISACIGSDLCIPTDENGRIMINYRGGNNTYLQYSVTDILNNKISSEKLKNKIVILGATAVGIYDLRVTPFSNNFPGLGIHANIIDSIIAKDFLRQPGYYRLLDTMAILFSGIILGFILSRLGVISGGIASFMVVFGYSFLCLYLFVIKGIVLNMTYPVLVAICIYIGGTAYKYFIEASQKRFIKDAFSTYLAPTVVKQLIESPEKLELGGELREITAFFSDVQGFTSISEKLSPQELVELLNEFLTEMTNIILKHEGTVDKFEGDAIIAFFGAPNILENHGETATIACIEMQKRMGELRDVWRKNNRPELKMRIGLSSGPAVVGNMGSKNRMDYTMMGDTVNTAARLESVNKVYGIYTLVSETTFSATGNRIFSREIDSISVIGKEEPVAIYEPIDYKEEVDSRIIRTVDLYSKGLKSYRARDWNHAISFFKAALEASPDDGPAKTLLARCQRFTKEPPSENWNGVFSMKTK